MSVSIQPFCLAMANRFSLDPPSTRRTAADSEGQLISEGRLIGEGQLISEGRLIEDLSLADARAIVEAGLRERDDIGEYDDDDDTFDANPDDDLRPLLEQRLALLPEGGRAPTTPPLDATEAAGHIADFLSHVWRLGEHPDEMHDLVRTMLGFAMMCHDRDILRWTPPRVATFLEQWLPDHGLLCEECGESHEHPPDEEWLTTVESAFPRWLRYAAGRSDLSDDAVLSALGERDPQAEICCDRHGNPEPDPELRDTETVPLLEEVDDYIAREVLPHIPDAWVDDTKTRIGYEIPFNRHFYVYEPPRPLNDIDADLQALEHEIIGLLAEVTE